MNSLELASCPDGMTPCLQALWYDAWGEWETAHEIVQRLDEVMAARVHAYLHRKQGDNWNSRYWHRRAGSQFPTDMNLEDEWTLLVKALAK